VVCDKKETQVVNIGLVGFGKAGMAVADVLMADPRYTLRWVARRRAAEAGETVAVAGQDIPVLGLASGGLETWLDEHPVDAVVDFSRPDAVFLYGEEIRQRGIALASAISAYTDKELDYVRSLGEHTRVMASPNITLGINFLILAAKLLRGIAPFADVEILEQHFREKPEVSGTARKIAQTLEVEEDNITSLRLGGIVGHHEVIFGFPHQTVRLIHNAIRREAFGTGAAFALAELLSQPTGFYTFDDLLMARVRRDLLVS
jgi:4-hydroxy-tetrahydrodipicolinate reductase